MKTFLEEIDSVFNEEGEMKSVDAQALNYIEDQIGDPSEFGSQDSSLFMVTPDGELSQVTSIANQYKEIDSSIKNKGKVMLFPFDQAEYDKYLGKVKSIAEKELSYLLDKQYSQIANGEEVEDDLYHAYAIVKFARDRISTFYPEIKY